MAYYIGMERALSLFPRAKGSGKHNEDRSKGANAMTKRKYQGDDKDINIVQEGGLEAPKEGKADKFKRLANARVPKAMKALIAVKRLSNRSTYHYTPEEARKLISVLKATLASVEDAFSDVNGGGEVQNMF